MISSDLQKHKSMRQVLVAKIDSFKVRLRDPEIILL